MGYVNALPLIIVLAVFALLVVVPMRRQMRRQREVQSLQTTLAVDSEVMTTSGLYGRVVAVEDRTIDLEVAPEVTVRFARAAIGEIVAAQPAHEPEEAEPAEHAQHDEHDEQADDEHATSDNDAR